MSRPLTIALLHPELGFGGSERLMIDAALELKRRGHQVSLFTARCEPERTFQDVSLGGLDIRVRAVRVPYDLAGYARVPCAILRMAALAKAARRECGPLDVVLCDLVPHAVPIVRAIARAPVLFYCHYPDSLLAPSGGAWYGWYRGWIDALERSGMRACSRIVTNSRFTLAALHRAVSGIDDIPTDVIAPGVDVDRFGSVPELRETWAREPEIVLLSIGRFHRDKNHALAIETLALLKSTVPAETASRLRLVIAGGCDERLEEPRAVFEALEALAASRGVAAQVQFVRSPADDEQLAWLSRASMLLHTAPAEHFGIVPLEAMAAGRPVIAVNHGGPAETVRHEDTGLLCAPTAEAFRGAVAHLLANARMGVEMGARARQHAAAHFRRETFGAALDAAIQLSIPK